MKTAVKCSEGYLEKLSTSRISPLIRVDFVKFGFSVDFCKEQRLASLVLVIDCIDEFPEIQAPVHECCFEIIAVICFFLYINFMIINDSSMQEQSIKHHIKQTIKLSTSFD